MTNVPVDWCELDRITNNKKELAKEMVAMLANELPFRQEKINLALAEENWDALFSHVHKLHGSSAYCAATQLCEVAAELESQLKKQQHDNAHVLVDRINQKITVFLAAVQNDE